MLNEKIVKAGYANVMTIPPNVKYQDRFLRVYKEARKRSPVEAMFYESNEISQKMVKRMLKKRITLLWSVAVFMTIIGFSGLTFADVIIDNGDAGTSRTGTWLTILGRAWDYDSSSVQTYDFDATYSYEASVNGTHVVSLWWSEDVVRGNTRVPVEIYDGTHLLDTKYVNQRQGGGKWNLQGMYCFNGKATVVINSGQRGGKTSADAVKFTPTVDGFAGYGHCDSWSKILPASDRFELVMDEEAVLDKETGLVWEKVLSDQFMNWYDAVEHCYKRSIGGRHGWRLPTVEELASLMGGGLPRGHPFTLRGANFWTITTDTSPTTLAGGRAWIVNIEGNVLKGQAKDAPNRLALCVRGRHGHDGNDAMPPSP